MLGALVKSPIEVCAYVNIFPTGFDVVASEIDVIAGVCIHAMQFCLSSIQRIHCTASTGHIRLPTFWQCWQTIDIGPLDPADHVWYRM